MTLTAMTETGLCREPDCGDKTIARGMCVVHYARWYRVQKAETAERPRCVECDRPMRKHKEGPIPGVVIKGANGKCNACYMRERRAVALPADPGRTECERCGCKSSRVLCRDCRDVMSKEEVAAWAA